MPGMLTGAEMRELDQARGRDFDRLFLTSMIRHHRGAITMVDELFGSYGAGSSLLWVDPVSDVSFSFLSSGVMDEGDNVARFQKLSTIAASAVSDN